RFNQGHCDRDARFRRVHHVDILIFLGDFGIPWWRGPSWGWNGCYYPYGPYQYSEYSYPSYYSGYGYGYGNYGYGYGYGYPSGTYYGSYYTAPDYENDESIVRNVLAEYTVSWNRHDTAAVGRLFTENCDYINMAGGHWKGVHEVVRGQAELFQNRLNT